MAHFLTNHQYPYGNKLCPSSCRSFPILRWGWLYTKTYQWQKHYRRYSLQYTPKILIYRKLREQLPLLLFLTFTLHLTPMVSILPDYDKRDDFNFVIIKFPHLDSIYIPTAPANGVYISQLVRYARACSLYSDF